MGLSTRQQWSYWGVFTVVVIAFLWMMGNTLLPFVVGAAIAYLLDPLADWFEARGFSRVAATAIITGGVIVCLVTVLLVLVPLIIQQLDAAIQAMPGALAALRDFLAERFPSIFEADSGLRQALTGMEDSLRDSGLKLAQALVSSSLAALDAVLVIVLAPVIAFYLLMDWDRMIARIDDLIPREHLNVVRGIARDVDAVLAGFVRGQVTVCLILGGFYAIALTILGLKFGAVIGIFAGVVSFIPFVGAILGGIFSLGVALFQFWGDWGMIAAVAVVFGIGQAVEGNVLTPNLVGDKVKLHPVWLIFALSAFGAVLGFAGMLIAVPVAAVIGVVSRFAVSQYKDGRLYTGPQLAPNSGPDPENPTSKTD